MYCQVCGKEVEDDALFCPFCGADLSGNKEGVEARKADIEDNGPWKVFATIGYVLGIIGFVTSFMVIGLEFGVPGIVFSALGKKSTNPERQRKAKTGLKLSIAATIIGFIATIIFASVLAILILGGYIDVASGGGMSA